MPALVSTFIILPSAFCISQGAHLDATTMQFANSLAPRSGERVRVRGSIHPMGVVSRCAHSQGARLDTATGVRRKKATGVRPSSGATAWQTRRGGDFPAHSKNPWPAAAGDGRTPPAAVSRCARCVRHGCAGKGKVPARRSCPPSGIGIEPSYPFRSLPDLAYLVK